MMREGGIRGKGDEERRRTRGKEDEEGGRD